MSMLPIALAGLGGFLIYETMDKQPAKPPSLPKSDGQTSSKFAPLNGLTVQPLVGTRANPKDDAAATLVGGGVPKNPFLVPILRNGSASKNSKATNGSAGQLIDQTTAKVAAAYAGMTKDAKMKGADILNAALKPSPGLTGNESFEDATKKITAALGTAVGGSIGGPAGAALGAIVGAYLGKELGPWLHEKWGDLESWTKSKLGTVGTVEQTVEKDLHKAYDEIASWF